MLKLSRIIFCILFLSVAVFISSANSQPLQGLGQKLVDEKVAQKKSKPERILETEKYLDKNIGQYVDVVAGEILVKFRPSVSTQSIDNLNKKNQVQIIKKLSNKNTYSLSLSTSQPLVSVGKLLEGYKNDPSVEYAEPNFIRHALSTTPNDTYYSEQWGLPQIKAGLGWDLNKGSSSLAIAIIDTGVGYNHPDLKNKIWINTGEIKGNNIDDDGNGYIDDWLGWDFAYDINDPIDWDGHGSHVAGIAAAETNNSKGVAGVSWNSRIMAVNVFYYQYNNTAGRWEAINAVDSVVADGIKYAADNGAKVINLSLGGSSFNNTLNDAVQYAHNKGCVIVAAAGNNGGNSLSYPASYLNVISVASVDKNDTRSSFSNYNPYVDVCAPGGAANSDYKNDILSNRLASRSVPSGNIKK